MPQGKAIDLEEARQLGQLDRFCEEHPAEADRDLFEQLLHAMTLGLLEEEETSEPDRAASSSGIRTQQDTSQDGDG